MKRTLVIAFILTAVIAHRFALPFAEVATYTFTACVATYLLYPTMARQIRRRARRNKARTRNQATRRSDNAAKPSATQHLTQINVHHHYYNGAPVAPRPAPVPARLGIPQRGRQQIIHDNIYDAL
ncbi:hypothetical protein [Mycobacteroides abscessus]|uniref:hypothetical protein n=1 Tax=Mycobacteroides abscessus TaxID=36809 RepID=UPI0009A79993|nr:hypothetical protein [Mycobacteroides abscessus]SKT85610.1 Uncharacterised protein [Mycobacteroides abscessus subsp. massiliense]SKU05172.1 Uncharacterised protein [Mycobacteroides abscessus subsp. massiliense]